MYAQITDIRVPYSKISELRQVIEGQYLPVVQQRPGFLAAYLLEQVDDRDSAQLTIFWDDQAAVENFHRTGLLEASVQSLAAYVPGVQIHRQGYIVRVAVRGQRIAEAVTS
ncbi:MAG: antibiotic biosynthesis monooxygenase [Anaerolineae bacterium]|nr:antibiotic biosynthesis monooxygenase [Anaerolineae bacterium]